MSETTQITKPMKDAAYAVLKGFGLDSYDAAHEALARALSASPPPPSVPVGVTVKPLEWDGPKATTSIGKYMASEVRSGLAFLTLDGRSVGGSFQDRVAAMKAAQADYETRILSALSTAVSKTEAVAWKHEITEPDGQKTVLLSNAAENPWSHWLAAHRIQCEYAITPLYATPPTEPALIAELQAKVERMTEALKGLEQATEQLASTRSLEAYDAMIKCGQADALIALDNARRSARAALSDGRQSK